MILKIFASNRGNKCNILFFIVLLAMCYSCAKKEASPQPITDMASPCLGETDNTQPEGLPDGNLSEETESHDFDKRHESVWANNNPIDQYYLPRIYDAWVETERKELEMIYRRVWIDEFDNIMYWMLAKCVYQEDIDVLLAYEKSVQDLADSTWLMCHLDWYDWYNIPKEDRTVGNGTHGAICFIQGEIYRNAGMELIGGKREYEFLDKDYSSINVG